MPNPCATILAAYAVPRRVLKVKARSLLLSLVCVISTIATLTAQTFTEVPTVFRSIYTGSHVWGDFDNDGDLDVILSGFDGSQFGTWLYLNNGSGGFVEVPNAFPPQTSGALTTCDVDHDSYLDVLVGEDGVPRAISFVHL